MFISIRYRDLLILFTLITLAIIPCLGQQPLSDGEKKGTLLLDTGGFFQFNAADPSIRFGYIYDKSKAGRKTDWTLGVGVGAKLNNNQGSLIGSNKIAASAQFDVSGGLKYLFAKKFEAKEVMVTTVFLAGMERVLKKNGTISQDARLPNPKQLGGMLTSSIPTITLASKNKFINTLKDLIKSLGDKEELQTYLKALSESSNTEQRAKIQLLVDELEKKQRIKNALETLALDIENKASIVELVSVIEDRISTDPALKPYLENHIRELRSKAAIVDSFDAKQKPAQLIAAPTLDRYLNDLVSLCLVISKTDSFCGIKGNEIGEIFQLDELKKYGNFDRLVFQGGYIFRQYNLFNPSATFAEQLNKKDFHSPSAQLIYTYQLGGNKLIGASIGMEKSNNSSELTEIDIRDYMTATSGTTTREFGRSRKALLGDFRQYTRTFVNTDLAWFPGSLKSRVGINFFTRSVITGNNKGFRPGIGVFLSEKGAPTRVVGGVTAFMDEKGKANISLTAGYNF